MKQALFFLPSLGSGGAESHTLRVLNHLDRARIRPVVALGRTDGSYQRLLEADVEVHHVSSHRVGSSLGRMALSALPLRLLVQRLRPDVVCPVMDMPNLVAATALAAMPARPALTLVVQAPPSRNFEGAQRAFVLGGVRRLYPRADLIFSLSHGVARDLTEIHPPLEEKIRVVHNACVDASISSAARIDRPTASTRPRPVLLACGRLVPQKGFGDLLEAFDIARRSIDAELWIAGEGPLRGALESKIAMLGLAGRVRLLGFQQDPQWLMARADVFVLSSRFEGFGNVLVEAMAVGTPVISTACPFGPEEILRDGESGLLVPVAEPATLAAAIVRVLRDDDLRARLGRSAAERAQDFHARAIAEQYAAVFEEASGLRRR